MIKPYLSFCVVGGDESADVNDLWEIVEQIKAMDKGWA